MGIPTGQSVGSSVGKVGSGESGAASGAFLFDEKKARCSVWEFPCGQVFHVFGAIGTDLPEEFRVVAMFRAGDGFAAGTMVQCGFKFEGSPFADLTCVFLFDVFLVASEGVSVDALLKCGDARLGAGSFELGAGSRERGARRRIIFNRGWARIPSSRR